MRSVPMTQYLGVAALACLFSGCYGPMGQYGSPYGYPGSPPVQTLTPGAPYTPGGAYPTIPNQPTPVQPNTTFSPQDGGDAPFFNPSTTGGGAYEGGVPNPSDPGTDWPLPSNTADGAVDEYGSIEGASASVAAVAKVPTEHAHFEQPTVAEPQPTLATPVAANSSSYAYDAEHYGWLRGMLQFDSASRQWSIVYSTNPGPSDPFGGRLSLQGDSRLTEFAPGTFITVQGAVDSTTVDSFNRPTFRIVSVVPFDPNPIP